MLKEVSDLCVSEDAADINLASDNTWSDEAAQPRELYVGTTGNVKVKTRAGTDVTYKNVPAGTTITGYIQKLYSSSNGTTASDIVAKFK